MTNPFLEVKAHVVLKKNNTYINPSSQNLHVAQVRILSFNGPNHSYGRTEHSSKMGKESPTRQSQPSHNWHKKWTVKEKIWLMVLKINFTSWAYPPGPTI